MPIGMRQKSVGGGAADARLQVSNFGPIGSYYQALKPYLRPRINLQKRNAPFSCMRRRVKRRTRLGRYRCSGRVKLKGNRKGSSRFDSIAQPGRS